MKKNLYCPFGLVITLVLFLSVSLGTAKVDLDINMDVEQPPKTLTAPPEMVLIPETSIYYVKDRKFDIFFCNGYWWSPRAGRWYRSLQYKDSWALINRDYVPAHLLKMAKNYREGYKKENPVNYGQEENDYQSKGNKGLNRAMTDKNDNGRYHFAYKLLGNNGFVMTK